jgi:hypothetical protein
LLEQFLPRMSLAVEFAPLLVKFLKDDNSGRASVPDLTLDAAVRRIARPWGSGHRRRRRGRWRQKGGGAGVAGWMTRRKLAAGAGTLLIVGGGLGGVAAAQSHASQPRGAQIGSSGPLASVPAAGPTGAVPARSSERARGIAGGREQVMPAGVPALQVGKLLVNDTGDNLASWPRQQRGTGGAMTHSNGVLYLSTSGANGSGYSMISPNTYTSGIFEARIYFPGASDGKIADWPAFWLSSAWSGAVSWPDGGEMDLAEGLRGDLAVAYHYGIDGMLRSITPFSVTSAPGWHTITGVWKAGEWDTYYDGGLVTTITGVVVNDPMNVILSAYQGSLGDQPGVRSTIEVSNLRIWSLASS